jgi:hypothetical protein
MGLPCNTQTSQRRQHRAVSLMARELGQRCAPTSLRFASPTKVNGRKHRGPDRCRRSTVEIDVREARRRSPRNASMTRSIPSIPNQRLLQFCRPNDSDDINPFVALLSGG